MKVEIIWHKFSYPDSMPPMNVGILITDGEIVTVTELKNYFADQPVESIDDISLHGHGFGGYEWDYDFDDVSKITHWALLPPVPKERND